MIKLLNVKYKLPNKNDFVGKKKADGDSLLACGPGLAMHLDPTQEGHFADATTYTS